MPTEELDTAAAEAVAEVLGAWVVADAAQHGARRLVAEFCRALRIVCNRGDVALMLLVEIGVLQREQAAAGPTFAAWGVLRDAITRLEEALEHVVWLKNLGEQEQLEKGQLVRERERLAQHRAWLERRREEADEEGVQRMLRQREVNIQTVERYYDELRQAVLARERSQGLDGP